MMKLLVLPVAAIVLAVPMQRSATPMPAAAVAPGSAVIEREADRSADRKDPLVEELLQMQQELQGMREQAMLEALQELEELDARIVELEDEREKVLDRIDRIASQEEPSTEPGPYGRSASPIPSAL